MFKPIDEKEFLKRFRTQVYNRLGGVDPTEESKYFKLKEKGNFEYFEGTIEEGQIENLIIPHNAKEIEQDRSPNMVVKVGGESFNKVINDFKTNFITNNRFPKTVKKVLKFKEQFFETDLKIFDANFIFISNDRKIAHDDKVHYDITHGDGKLYLGNGFNRLIAYG